MLYYKSLRDWEDGSVGKSTSAVIMRTGSDPYHSDEKAVGASNLNVGCWRQVEPASLAQKASSCLARDRLKSVRWRVIKEDIQRISVASAFALSDAHVHRLICKHPTPPTHPPPTLTISK